MALAAFVLIALALIFDVMPGDQNAGALAHGTLAIFVFMGLFAMGFASILIPMFALACSAPEGRTLFVMALFCVGLVLAVFGITVEQDQLSVMGMGLMMLGAVSHILVMTGLLKKGMKKKLGISFVLIRTSWVLFPLSIAIGIAAVSGAPFEDSLLLAAFLALFGWLLTFIMGVLQHIIPFLAAMNVSAAGGKSPRLSVLARGMPLKVHVVCHFLGVGLVGLGVAINLELPVQIGATFGLVGRFNFLWFIFDVYRRMASSTAVESTPTPSNAP